MFFKRFMREVIEVGGDGSMAGTLAATEPELTWGFRKTFERLDRMADELRKDRSRPKLAQAVTLYHVVIEASLAQPGQHFIESYLNERKLLPGFQEGMRNVSLDEQRHIGFGVKLLSDLIREDHECVDAIVEMLNEIIPVTTAVLVPPNWDRSYTECFGFTLEDIYAEGATSMESKLRAMGMPQEAMDRISLPVRPARARARRARHQAAAGQHARREGRAPSRDPEAIAILFDSIRRSADPRVVPPGTTIQWDFDDAEPWYLQMDNGSTRMQQGRAEHPDLTLRSSFEDFVDVIAGREDPRRQLLRRKLRPSGRVRMLLKLPKLFA